MKFSEEALILELIWKYDYSQEEATEIVNSYIEKGEYDLLMKRLAKKFPKGIPVYKEV